VVDFVAFLDSAKDGDGVFHAWFVDHDWLEAAFEGGVFFDVLAIFVEGGGTDGVEFAACELGFEEVRGIDGTLGGSGSDDRVEFVDEEDDLAFAGGDFLEECLEAVFEFAAEFCSGDHGPDIHGDDFFVVEGFGDIACDDAAGEALDDGGLSDAWFADEDRVVLGAAGEDLHGAADFIVASDDWIDFSFAGLFGEVASVFFECLVFTFRVGVGHALGSADFDQGSHEFFAGEAGVAEDFARVGFSFAEGDEDVLGAEVFVLELLHFGFREVDGLAEFGAHVGA